MGFNAYPALSIRQPDLGRTLSTAEAIKSSRMQNQLLQRKIKREDTLTGMRTNMLAAGAGPSPAGGGAPRTGIDSPIMRRYLAIDPQGGSQIIDAISKMNDEQQKQMKQQNGMTARLLMSIEDAPPEQRAAAYAQALNQAQQMGIAVDNAPPQYDPQWVQRQIMLGMGIDDILKERDRQRLTKSDVVPVEGKGGARYMPVAQAVKTGAPPAKQYKADAGTALQRNVPFIAKTLGIPKNEAMTIALQSKTKGEAATRDAMYLAALRYHGDSAMAWEQTQEGMQYLYPDPNAPAPKPKPEKEPGVVGTVLNAIRSGLGLGEEGAASAAPGSAAPTAAPTAATAAPAGEPPQSAIDYLLLNPATAGEFDAKYGDGMAWQYLNR